MAYNGATAASTLSNPPIQISEGGLGGINRISTGSGGGNKIWRYDSSNATSDLASSNYFTDAYYLGMKAGDLLLGTAATGSSVTVFMGVIGTVTTAGAALATSGGYVSSSR